MLKSLLTTILSVVLTSTLFAQQIWIAPAIKMQHSYGGSANDKASKALATADGGFIVVGSSLSDDDDVTSNYGLNDVWIVKTDAAGNILWQKNYGGDNEDFGVSIIETFDGGYLVGATTFSNTNDVTGNNGFSDFWVFKIDANGTLIWSKVLGGSLLENLYQVKQLKDSSYVAVGSTDSDDGYVTGNHGESDYWVVRLNQNGDTTWTACYGGTTTDVCRDMNQLANGDFVLAGYSNSNNGDLTNNYGGFDYWVLRVDDVTDSIVWQYNYGGSYDDRAYSITLNNALGYLVVGSSYSNDINVSGHSGSVGPTGNSDLWALKLTNLGIIDWENSYGGLNDEASFDAVQLTDSSYTIAGYSSSLFTNTTPNNGLTDYWIISLNRFGNRQWGEVYGGSLADFCFSIDTITNNSYLIAGNTFSNDSDVTNNNGGSDYWVVKLDSAANITGISDATNLENNMVKVLPNPFTTNGKIVISSEKLIGKKCTLNIYSAEGKMISSYDAGDRTVINLNRNNFQAGVYYYKLICDNQAIATGKLIAQ